MELSPSPALVGRWADLPEDIALAIASRLQEADVCALGGCSRSWRSACDADCVWERLFRRRWPAAAAEAAAGGGEGASRVQGWKSLYINQHRRMAVAISNVVEFVGSSLHNGLLEAEFYLKAFGHSASVAVIGFLDVQFFLFSRNQSAIINLIGLHYSIALLLVPPNEVNEALQAHQVAEKRVCVNLLKGLFGNCSGSSFSGEIDSAKAKRFSLKSLPRWNLFSFLHREVRAEKSCFSRFSESDSTRAVREQLPNMP